MKNWQIKLWKNLYIRYKMPAEALSHPSFMLAVFSAAPACRTRKLTSVSVADREPHSLARREADEIMTPPAAIALHASKVHHKNCWANPKRIRLKMKKETLSVNRRRTEMKQDRDESDESRRWGEEEDGSCSQDDGDLPTAPSERATSA